MCLAAALTLTRSVSPVGLHGLAELGVDADPSATESNIVLFKITHPTLEPEALCERLANSEGGVSILMWPYGPKLVRAVTHYSISADDIDKMIAKTKQILTSLS